MNEYVVFFINGKIVHFRAESDEGIIKQMKVNNFLPQISYIKNFRDQTIYRR